MVYESDRLAQPTVMVIEDDPQLIAMMKMALGHFGFKVMSATNGYEALGMLKDDCPDLILLDLMMPGLSGEEVFDRIKADPELRDIPVAILTAKTADKHTEREQWLEKGAVDLVIKPFRIHSLVKRLGVLV